jgi:hypothetical protein
LPSHGVYHGHATVDRILRPAVRLWQSAKTERFD